MAFRIPTNGLTVQFTVDNTNPDTGESVQFTDLTFGATNWLWDFGDGDSSELQNPTHTYLTAGDYTVSLVAWKDGEIAGVNIAENYIDVVNNFDPDALAFFLAAGITNSTEQSAVNQLVVDLKANSLWTNMNAIYPFVGGTATSNKYNLKDPRDLDAAFRLEYRGTAPTHDSNGITFNSGGYASTWCVPGTSALDRSYGEYIRQAFNDGWSGSFIGAVFGFKVNTAPSVTAYGVNNLLGGGFGIDYGYLNSSIVSSTEAYMFNNSTIKYSNLSSVGSDPIPGVIYIGAMNTGTAGNDGPWGEYSQRTLSFAHLGNGLTPTQNNTLVSIIQTYQTTLGRNV
jgi:PKD repeat protein